ncbi:hypothetical protein BS47DRAFT_1371293 [Hydnum rufescens UP504]|uniref:non-specific serine/threonine protein kinase n=1 Tax=Hydnum rufescens UP504 TaxID=1448309 RepID=A0A9P6B548_9AGAM|nr:hypothetical protein BS47DRAFT_1371293 [Hydnum rufescens UP504]
MTERLGREILQAANPASTEFVSGAIFTILQAFSGWAVWLSGSTPFAYNEGNVKTCRPTPQSGHLQPNTQITFAPNRLPYFNNYNEPKHPHPLISDAPHGTLSRGTLLHKGFYDLLSIIPNTASAVGQVALGGSPEVRRADVKDIGGPRYESLPPTTVPDALLSTAGSRAYPNPSRRVLQKAPPTVALEPRSIGISAGVSAYFYSSAKQPRRVSKDSISAPTGFVHLVHASDAEQAEALLSRWGPDGMGKVAKPYWAQPIKNMLKDQARARSAARENQPVSPVSDDSGFDLQISPSNLHVVNGTSALTSTTGETSGHGPPSPVLTRKQKSKEVSEPPRSGAPSTILSPTSPPSAFTRNSTVKITKALHETPGPLRPPCPKFEPSIMTLDRAASAKIYFENIYFPIFRKPPSREQRRLALERDLLQMGHLPEAAKNEIRERWRKNETDYLRQKRQRVSPEAFSRLKVIGHGAFGVVTLVREKSSGGLYAMKQLRKVDMLRKGQEGHVRAERDVLKAASLVPSSSIHEWIIKLHYSFQDRENLYLILEYMGGGDLLNLLIERDVFEESFTRFYVAEMILAIEQCHQQGFIHRDIKPDNFLFDPHGHIKLSDFGLATDLHWAHDTSYYEQQRKDLLRKHGIDLQDGQTTGLGTRKMSPKDVERLMGKPEGDATGGIFTWREKNRRKVYTFCGTNSYMSPEVIRGHGYTFSCDWWSLGVIIFECLYGYPPFVSNSRHVTRQMILNWRKSLRFPASPHVSHDGVDLIGQLLREPEDRLGSQSPSSVLRPNSMFMQARMSGYASFPCKAHPWFRGIDWANIHRARPPFRPNLRDPADTRHFDDNIPAETLAPANGAPPDATKDPVLRDKLHGADILDTRKQLAFAGFTHKSPRAVTYPRVEILYPSTLSRGADLRRNSSGSTFGRSRALSV